MQINKFCFCSNTVKEIFKKCFTLNEAIAYLDNLEVSVDNSDSEDDRNFQSAKTFIEPLVNSNNEKSKIDAGDENQPTGDAVILSGNLLLSFSFFTELYSIWLSNKKR